MGWDEKGLASVVEANEVGPESSIPGVFSRRVAERAARAAASEGFAEDIRGFASTAPDFLVVSNRTTARKKRSSLTSAWVFQ